MRDYQAPEVIQVAEPTFETTEADRFETAEPVSDWWQQFNDEDLSDLVEAALEHNRSIHVAIANLNEARALAGATRRDRLPTAEVNGAATASRESNEGLFGPLPDRNVETYNAGVDAFWELDLFGRISNRIAISDAQVDIADADLRGMYVSIAAETAFQYIELRGAQYRLAVANRNATNQTRTFELTQDLEEAGRSDRLNVVRARTQLELTQSTIPIIESEVNAHLNRLVVLTGRALPDLRDRLSQARSLPSIPNSVAVGDPVSMLQRRPDIAAAERQLAAATAQYNLNVADLYPKVTLFGSLGFLSTSFGELGNSSSFTGSIGPQISWAGFNMGRVHDRIDAADARTQAQLAHFEETVFRALEETHTAMVNFTKSEASRERLYNAAKASEEAVELAQLRFDAGVDDFLDVLDAERTLLNAQEALARVETQTAWQLIGVYKSLGGGWQVGQTLNSQVASNP
jgi:multidrug efflux system outer membrane protein